MGWLRLIGSLRWGWVFLERTRILGGIQFTTHFIEFFVVETKRFVGSFVNVILTRQTCGQRSSRAADSKRRALENDFSEQICCMFLISKCRGDRDLGLCTTFGVWRTAAQWLRGVWRTAAQWLRRKLCTDLDLGLLACGEPQRNGKIRFFLHRNTFFFRKSWLPIHAYIVAAHTCIHTDLTYIQTTIYTYTHIQQIPAGKARALWLPIHVYTHT